MESIVSVRNLSFSYTGNSTQSVFRDVDFSVSAGEVLCLLGPNGTGKSTLLKCMSNVLQGWRGTVLLKDKDISRMKLSLVAKGIGYVPQNQSSTFPFLVKDIVAMGRAPYLDLFSTPAVADLEVTAQAMEAVGILPLAERPCTTLSGGEWQLTLIARALAQEPQILILDEPTSHLDLGNQVRILRAIKSLADSGMGIVMATHFPDHAFIVATTVAIMNGGGIVWKGSPDEVLTEEHLQAAYGVEVRVLSVEEGINRKACLPSLRDIAS